MHTTILESSSSCISLTNPNPNPHPSPKPDPNPKLEAWGPFTGEVYRGIRHAFPQFDKHDPEKYFYTDRQIYWYDFKVSSSYCPS